MCEAHAFLLKNNEEENEECVRYLPQHEGVLGKEGEEMILEVFSEIIVQIVQNIFPCSALPNNLQYLFLRWIAIEGYRGRVLAGLKLYEHWCGSVHLAFDVDGRPRGG